MKAFADNKTNVTKTIEICFEKGRKHSVKSRKRKLPAFSHFPPKVFKSFLSYGG